MLINKIVIGVSGGPDSMYLLNKVYENKKFEPIVVHINYNFRKESKEEQQFVEDFCKEHEIKIYSYEVSEDDFKKYAYLGNKQSIARQIRFDKYIEVARENNARDIFLAQHKDDYIETAIMQEKRSDEYLYYGIQQVTKFKDIKIHRPLLDMWKKDIIKSLDKQGLEYRIDRTNYEPIYERNIIRLDLAKKTNKKKEEIYNKYQLINESKKELRLLVDEHYKYLIEDDFSYDTYLSVPDEIKKHVIYNMLIHNEKRINISSEKIEGIIEFLSHKRGDKSFRLMENIFMSVKSSKIIIYN